jgi:hypothetical protein
MLLKLQALGGVSLKILKEPCEPYHTRDWNSAGIWRRLMPLARLRLVGPGTVPWVILTMPLWENPQGGESFNNCELSWGLARLPTDFVATY